MTHRWIFATSLRENNMLPGGGVAAVRRMHITVPSGATVITSDLSKYLTGPKSGIKAEVEEAEEKEKARDMS